MHTVGGCCVVASLLLLAPPRHWETVGASLFFGVFTSVANLPIRLAVLARTAVRWLLSSAPLSGVAVDRSTGTQGGELMSAAARQERLLELYAQDQVLQRRVATRHGWRQRHAATVPAGVLVVVVGQSRGQREFEIFTSDIQR